MYVFYHTCIYTCIPIVRPNPERETNERTQGKKVDNPTKEAEAPDIGTPAPRGAGGVVYIP